jgi:hypothetical protein
MLLASYFWSTVPAYSELEGKAEVVAAAFLVKFPNFIVWPKTAADSTTEPFVIAVLGDSRIYDKLSKIDPEVRIADRPLFFKKSNSVDAVTGAQIVFISDNFSSQLGSVVEKLADYPVLTITDISRGYEQGVMITFLVHDNRVAFKINRPQAEKVGLDISFRLLQIALKTGGQND